MSNLAERVADARYRIRKMKETLPEAFIEYSRFLAAEQALEAAKAEYRVAKTEWDSVGK